MSFPFEFLSNLHSPRPIVVEHTDKSSILYTLEMKIVEEPSYTTIMLGSRFPNADANANNDCKTK